MKGERANKQNRESLSNTESAPSLTCVAHLLTAWAAAVGGAAIRAAHFSFSYCSGVLKSGSA